MKAMKRRRLPEGGKRLLRTIDANIVTKVIKVPKTVTIDDLLNTKQLDEILDPKRADKILAKKPLARWLDKKTLVEVLNGNFEHKKKVFEGWSADKRTSGHVKRLIRSDPAIEKKYRSVYKTYGEYLSMIYRKKNRAKQLAGNK
ncbi:hypothetical protein PInf_002452 [Phytophthora infestans]|nr:hypothetical protein PInf_002452 [Phytophthora infestans]